MQWFNELDPHLIVLSSGGADYSNNKSAPRRELFNVGTDIVPDPQQGIQYTACHCGRLQRGEWCVACGEYEEDKWTGFPKEYPCYKPEPEKRRKTEVRRKTEEIESSRQLKLDLLLPSPDDQTYCQLNSIAVAQDKAKFFLDKTIKRLIGCGHGPDTKEELDAHTEMYQLAMSFLPLVYGYLTTDPGNMLDENGSIKLRPMGSGPESNQPGTYQIRFPGGIKQGYTKRTCNKRVSEQVKDSTVFMAFVTGLTTPELKEWLVGKDDLITLINRITLLSPAFKCHKSHEDEAFMESASRLMEYWISCFTVGDPVYVLEKHFDFADQETKKMFSLESFVLDPTVFWMLQNVVRVIKIKTWITFESALLAHIFSDLQTFAMVCTMMRMKEDGHLMEHIDWQGVSLGILSENNVTYETYDAVATTKPFESFKRVLQSKLIPILRRGNEEEVKREFNELIKDFSGDFETYVRPEDDVYQERCEQALLDVFADDSHDLSKTVVIEIEEAFLAQLSKSFVDKYLPVENQVGTFYRVANIRHNIVVSVTPSFFTMACHGEDGIQHTRTRIERFRSFIMNLKARQAMGLLSVEDFMTQVGIWKAAAINITGPFGTIDHANGSIPSACRYAVGEGYTINPFREGVRGLGNLLAPAGVGMKDAVVVAFVSVLGCEKFCLFAELYLGRKLEFNGFQSFLQTMKTEGAGMGRVVTQEARANIGAASKGRVVTQVTRDKLSAATRRINAEEGSRVQVSWETRFKELVDYEGMPPRRLKGVGQWLSNQRQTIRELAEKDEAWAVKQKRLEEACRAKKSTF